MPTSIKEGIILCIFPKHQKLNAGKRSMSDRKLFLALSLYLSFAVVEIIGGFKANSLAIQSNASCLLAHVANFAVSLISCRASNWEANPERYSYGFYRIQVIAALFMVQAIWMSCGILMYAAIYRAMRPTSIIDGNLRFA